MTIEKTLYTPGLRYRLLAVVSLLLTLLFGYRLVMGNPGIEGLFARLTVEPGLLFFFIVMLGLTFWSLRILISRVEVSTEGVTHLVAGRVVGVVESRQFIEIIETGRLVRSVSVLYHPLLANRLVNLDVVQTLNLPEVERMEQLVSQLQTQVPV